ncbi:hypothetical protein [uncultured Campylobacter sp.]|uniref:hypothetical protein n=1 Tax=uncultured Campylobacter sp. TaxID=218934 RepID=UPI0026314B84|nr:hypothetical protein [uncultured Campylobacter sp.]
MKNGAGRISPIKGQNLPPQQFANYAKTERSANHSTIANCLAISNFTETTRAC